MSSIMDWDSRNVSVFGSGEINNVKTIPQHIPARRKIQEIVEKEFEEDDDNNVNEDEENFYGKNVKYKGAEIFDPKKESDVFWKGKEKRVLIIEKRKLEKFETVEDLLTDDSWKEQGKGFLVTSKTHFSNKVIYEDVKQTKTSHCANAFRIDPKNGKQRVRQLSVYDKIEIVQK